MCCGLWPQLNKVNTNSLPLVINNISTVGPLQVFVDLSDSFSVRKMQLLGGQWPPQDLLGGQRAPQGTWASLWLAKRFWSGLWSLRNQCRHRVFLTIVKDLCLINITPNGQDTENSKINSDQSTAIVSSWDAASSYWNQCHYLIFRRIH